MGAGEGDGFGDGLCVAAEGEEIASMAADGD
jgi:hypothetical protein